MRTLIPRRENEWLSYLLQETFEGRDVIFNQLRNAEMEESFWPDNFSVKFFVPDGIQPFPVHNVRVPVIMLCHQSDSAPIVFMIHIINGIVDELEIYTADTSLLDVDNISFACREYIIDPSVKIK